MTSSRGIQICSRSVLDTTVPGIRFDSNGVSNYCEIYDDLSKAYPRGEKGKDDWNKIISKIKTAGASARYDCIIGVSGGTDSCYLLHLAKNEYGLRPLAVNLDNGWNSDIAVQNIKHVVRKLEIDLETYVINYEEIKDILKSFMKASLPWIDAPTDIAITASLYKTAAREGVKYIFTGNDFRSEGKQPTEWTYCDARQLKFIQKKFGTTTLKTFPNFTIYHIFYYGYLRGIRLVRPFYYLAHEKRKAQELLKTLYGWQYYGGHHHENIFTKFAIACWLPEKFGIDKRKITLSAQVLSNNLTRNEALTQLSNPPYDPHEMERDKEYVIKKLGMTAKEFESAWNSPNKYFYDYPSYYPLIKTTLGILQPLLRPILPFKPMIFTEMKVRKQT